MLQQRTSRNDSKRYSTHPVSGAKISPLSQNKHLWAVALLIFCCSICLNLCGSSSVSASTTSATITIGDMVGNNSLAVQGHKSRQAFYVPITINVKNAENYTVSFGLDSKDLVDGTSGNIIPSVTEGTSFMQLDDHWGMHYNFGDEIYANGNGNYNPAPEGEVTILPDGSDYVTGRVFSDEVTKILTISYAAAVRENFPAGVYTNRITVKVVASPLDTATTLHDIEWMQDMTPSVCKNTRTPAVSARDHDDTGDQRLVSDAYIPRTMLRDLRDDHYYIVEKLADGNCWMMENLALKGGTEISNADSNLMPKGMGPNSAGTPNSVNYTGTYTLPGSNKSGFNNDSAQHMYNGEETTIAATGGSDPNYVFNYVPGGSGVAGVVDISKYYNTTTHTGGYYNWLVAVAGNKGGATGDGPQATEDICPKGWQLPTGQATTGDFTKLYAKYSSNKANFDQVWHIVNNNSYVGYYNNSALADSAAGTNWWSRTSNSATNAYYLHEDTGGNIYPSRSYNRFSGFAIRCVAK